MNTEENDNEAGEKHMSRLFKRVSSVAQGIENVPDDFDPFDPALRVDAPGSITAWEALAHLLKGSLGTGILAMAHGFSQVGMLLGFVMTFIIVGILTHCVHIMLESEYFQCKKLGITYIEYPDCMEDAFHNGPPSCKKVAPSLPYIVDFFMLVYQLGTCSCYFLFMSYSIAQVMDMHGFHLNARVWMCIILIPIMLLNLIRDLHYLAPVSTLGIITFVISMCVIYYYMFGYNGSAFSYFSERSLFVWTPLKWPLFLGTTCFAMESIAIIVKIEHHMKEPKKFRSHFGVFNMGNLLTAFLFAMTGLCGYLKYGDKAESTITLNIAQDQILAQVVKFMYALVIFFSYPLQNFVPLELLWVNYINQHMTTYTERKKFVVEYFFREFIVIITFAFAMVIPKLDLLISLFGAFCLSSLGIIFPAVVHMLVTREKGKGFGAYHWIFYKDVLLIAFGTFILVSGTIVCILEIFQ